MYYDYYWNVIKKWIVSVFLIPFSIRIMFYMKGISKNTREKIYFHADLSEVVYKFGENCLIWMCYHSNFIVNFDWKPAFVSQCFNKNIAIYLIFNKENETKNTTIINIRPYHNLNRTSKKIWGCNYFYRSTLCKTMQLSQLNSRL